MNRFKMSLPWLLERLGARKWLRERAIHLPESVLIDAGKAAAAIAWQMAKESRVPEPTPAMWWRAVEQVQAQALGDGIMMGGG